MANIKSKEGVARRGTCVWGDKRHGVNMTNCCMIKGEARQALLGALFRSLGVIKTGGAESTHTTLNFGLTHC